MAVAVQVDWEEAIGERRRIIIVVFSSCANVRLNRVVLVLSFPDLQVTQLGFAMVETPAFERKNCGPFSTTSTGNQHISDDPRGVHFSFFRRRPFSTDMSLTSKTARSPAFFGPLGGLRTTTSFGSPEDHQTTFDEDEGYYPAPDLTKVRAMVSALQKFEETCSVEGLPLKETTDVIFFVDEKTGEEIPVQFSLDWSDQTASEFRNSHVSLVVPNDVPTTFVKKVQT